MISLIGKLMLILSVTTTLYGSEGFIDFDELQKEKQEILKKIETAKSDDEKQMLRKQLDGKQEEIDSVIIVLKLKRAKAKSANKTSVPGSKPNN